MTRFARAAVVVAAAIALAACAGEPDMLAPTSANSMVTPGPAHPTTPVQSAELPPPGGAAAPTEPPPAGQAQVAALPPGAAAPAAGEAAPPRIATGAQAAGLNGSWTLSAGGRACALTLREPPSSRAGWITAGADCPDGFAGAASWTLSGATLFLYDGNTRPIGRLSAVDANRFEGQSAQGGAISLAR